MDIECSVLAIKINNIYLYSAVLKIFICIGYFVFNDKYSAMNYVLFVTCSG